MNPNGDDPTLHDLLAQERAAVESYERVLAGMDRKGECGTVLEKIREEHLRSVQRLRSAVLGREAADPGSGLRSAGRGEGRPSPSEALEPDPPTQGRAELWTPVERVLDGASEPLPAGTAVRALRNGEEEGMTLCRVLLDRTDLEPWIRGMVETQLLVGRVRILNRLDRVIARAG